MRYTFEEIPNRMNRPLVMSVAGEHQLFFEKRDAIPGQKCYNDRNPLNFKRQTISGAALPL